VIGIKYQLFLFDPKAEKKDLLCVIDPAFDAPSAVDTILRTVKFENRKPIIVVGPGKELDEFVSKVERADLTEWLDLDVDARRAKLMEFAEQHNLSAMEDFGDKNTEPVFGDEEVTAAKRYQPPIHCPTTNHDIWFAVKASDDWKEILKLSKTHGYAGKYEVMEMIYANTYEIACQNEGRNPWAHTTTEKLTDARWTLKGQIIQGEESAQKLIDQLETHLSHAGILRRASNQKYDDVIKHAASNQFVLVHTIDWTLQKEIPWKQFTGFILREMGKKTAFHEGKDKLATKDKLGGMTELDLVRADGDSVVVFVKQYLTFQQASLLTQKDNEADIAKALDKYMRHWYKSGKFPDIEVSV